MYLYGASGHAKVVMDILSANGIKVKALVDDNPLLSDICGVKICHEAAGLSPLIISIGSNRDRKMIAECLSCEFGVAVHPSANISESAKIGEGSVVMAGTTVNADVCIGRHCIINTNASVDHECIVEDYVHISPNVAICGKVHVGEGSHIGVGASVIPGIKIGRWATIGAGATVITDVPDGATVVGTPARIIKIDNGKIMGGGKYVTFNLLCCIIPCRYAA